MWLVCAGRTWWLVLAGYGLFGLGTSLGIAWLIWAGRGSFGLEIVSSGVAWLVWAGRGSFRL